MGTLPSGGLVRRPNGFPPSKFCAVNTMEVQPDFRDLLALLNEHEVEYLIVGGYALAFHGAPRFTGDIDIFVRRHPENAQRVSEGDSHQCPPSASIRKPERWCLSPS